MPWITQKRIYRSDLQHNPNVLYLFGDNLVRKGLGGQAGEMRGEPNSVGIVTKSLPSMEEDAFFRNSDLYSFKRQLAQDLARVKAHLAAGGLCVLPEDGLGTGLSELPTRAPLLHETLILALRQIGAPT